MYDPPAHDRGYSTRDYSHDQPRDTNPYRDEYSGHSNSRDSRLYDTPLAPPPPARDQGPPRDRRDNPPRREYDDYRVRSSPPPPPVSRDRTGYYGSERDYSSGGAQPHRDPYPRHDRRRPITEDRSVPYPAHSGRARTPPGPPPSGRDDLDKVPR